MKTHTYDVTRAVVNANRLHVMWGTLKCVQDRSRIDSWSLCIEIQGDFSPAKHDLVEFAVETSDGTVLDGLGRVRGVFPLGDHRTIVLEGTSASRAQVQRAVPVSVPVNLKLGA